jgi:hypothetical protein
MAHSISPHDQCQFDAKTSLGGFRSSLATTALVVSGLLYTGADVWTLLHAGDWALIGLLHSVAAAFRLSALASWAALFGALLLSTGRPRTVGSRASQVALMLILFGAGSMTLFILVGAGA